MEIKIAVSDLSKALTMLQGVVQRKNTMPILSNVLINTRENNQLLLSATDLDVAMQLTKRCEVLSTGDCTVSARSLLDIVKMLPGPEVTLKTLDNQHLSIKSGRTTARLLALPASEFPVLPKSEGLSFQELNSDLFLSMVHKTLFSASSDDSRYNLTGVYFEPQADSSNSVVMVSTDGHRLSRIKENFADSNFSDFQPITLPKKGLAELVRLLDAYSCENEASFKLGVSEQHAIVMLREAYFSMRLIDGKFPDYHQVIPKLADKIMRASRNDFLLGLKRVSVLASEKNQSIKMKTKGGELTVSCVNPEAGEVTDDVAVEYNGPDIEIGFNAKYIIDALSAISDSSVMVKFTDPLSPTLITGMNDDGHQCVIMPMRM
ncbi:MAG: DNA polymerase III subunit beta [Myxococcales bacterium]|nr:DNA polymerase III subunit beta [Myxococcales bacterium]USN49820.1 MAG: DNA polymerase III subunit beta [Myxococcales bacterium]